MKGLIVALFVALIGFSFYNYLQVQDLKQEVSRLQAKLNEQQSGGVTDQVVAQAATAIAQAKDAISKMDTSRARSTLDSAREYLAQASKSVSEKSAPTVKWLEEQASDLGKKVDDRIHGKR